MNHKNRNTVTDKPIRNATMFVLKLCRALHSRLVERVCIRRSQLEQNVADRSFGQRMNRTPWVCCVYRKRLSIFMQKFRVDGHPSSVAQNLFKRSFRLLDGVCVVMPSKNINYTRYGIHNCLIETNWALVCVPLVGLLYIALK